MYDYNDYMYFCQLLGYEECQDLIPENFLDEYPL